MGNQKIIRLIISFCLTAFLTVTIYSCQNNQISQNNNSVDNSNNVRIGISSENLIFEEEITALTQQATGRKVTIVPKGSVSLVNMACKGEVDAIAIADEMWPNIKCPSANWVDTSGTLYQSRVQFALPKTTAQALGWDKKIVSRQEIVDKLKSGELQLATTIPTYSNSGYNTLLWLTRETITSSLTPEKITPESLQPLQPIYQNLGKSSESTGYLAEVLAKDWPENTIAALYRFLYAPDGTALYHHGQTLPLSQPVTLIEVKPAIAVTPTWFVTTEDETLKTQLIEGVFNQLETKNSRKFEQIKQLNPPLPDTVTREATPIAEVHRQLLDNFHPSIRQKRWIVGIIDASGSMRGQGYQQLLTAFSELLEPQKAKNNFLYSPNDRFSLIIYQKNNAYQIPLNSQPGQEITREILWETLQQEVKPGGATPVDKGLMMGLETALKISPDYKIEIFLFTDGQFQDPITPELLNIYQSLQEKNVELTVVGAGGIDAEQLQKLSAQLDARPIISSNASETLDQLLKAFREAQI
ncbi:VWA domain-containing protein [Crocosphaera sp.]|uniref:vWA domain-containing protein n=1 Tax=Crocosphaera sp. TaxID=2729996 RepID=UPI002610BE3C|nr:VWA domain-containing protein [Crocosphaera sp.]MDJ0581415.1 VWA domain-containing protein [Crocosphaera sp.]